MKSLCIFTPTYNRAYTLERLYNSLVAQTSQDFYWLIVDDGSTDKTEELVSTFIEKKEIPIVYARQENGGKQRAHNYGVELCESPLFICVDSDDWMPTDAVESLLSRWERVKDNPSVAGVIALCGSDPNTPLGTPMLAEGFSTQIDLYRHGHKGDTALMHRIELLRRFPFEVHPQEKFIAETFVYGQIDRQWTMAVLDKVVIVREYLEDGYTHNVRRISRENPYGYIKLKKMQAEDAVSLPERAVATTLYLVGYCLAKEPLAKGIREAPSPLLATILVPPAWVLAHTEFQK